MTGAVEARLDALARDVAARYPGLDRHAVQTLVIHDKWLAALTDAFERELDRLSRTMSARVQLLARRYATPLPQLNDELATLTARVDRHLKILLHGPPQELA